MKIAPIIEQLEHAVSQGLGVEYRLIHTGQHYDRRMSGDFFDQLGIPEPNINLGVGSGTQAEQTAGIMTGYEKVLVERRARVCIVVGDVTSTMACAIVAKKMGVDVAHVEAGIRSHDLTMPEEINRMVTDSITDLFFTTSEAANANLKAAGVPDESIHFVGNTMIDTLLKQMPRLIKPDIWARLDLEPKGYLVMTLHRPSNVDEEYRLKQLLKAITDSSRGIPLVFPVHPRTRKILDKLGVEAPNLHFTEPMGYLEFNFLVKYAKGVITDSGGITEETTVMNVPCMTLRDNTERPETITTGTNELVGTSPENIPGFMDRLFNGNWKTGGIPEMWDGKASERIVRILINRYNLQ